MKIFVKVKTKAKQKKIVKIETDHFEVSTNVSPEDGKANKDILKVLAKYFDIPVSKISIIFGEKSKNKTIEILNN
jgi:uncharacterized protein (TIGR00251 family)